MAGKMGEAAYRLTLFATRLCGVDIPMYAIYDHFISAVIRKSFGLAGLLCVFIMALFCTRYAGFRNDISSMFEKHHEKLADVCATGCYVILFLVVFFPMFIFFCLAFTEELIDLGVFEGPINRKL